MIAVRIDLAGIVRVVDIQAKRRGRKKKEKKRKKDIACLGFDPRTYWQIVRWCYMILESTGGTYLRVMSPALFP